jgi:nitrogen fixation/metabolism regulation signal transduction histidine kinase
MLFFRQFHIQLLIRLLGILFGLLATGWLWFGLHLYFTAVGTAILTALLIGNLYSYIQSVNGEISLFISAVRNRDNGAWFNPVKFGKPFSSLFVCFNEILATHRNITIEKEAIFQLMNSVLERAPFGLIVIPQAALTDHSGKHPILFINNAVEEMLQIPRFKYWDRIKDHNPDFAAHIAALASGGKKFIEYSHGAKTLLSIETQLIWSREEPLLIISFQDIRNEVEQKEMEAWNKLINVLTHEILNSITPIHSLAYSIKNILDEKGRKIDEEDLADLQLGATTIQKRTDGLMGFVSDYRHVAELPSPQLQPVIVSELFARVKRLMQPLAGEKSIRLDVVPVHHRYRMNVDENLIEQVLINLITNGIYAAEGRPDPLITISFHNRDGQFSLTVADNGKGIPASNLDKIFVPFFTTRDNGSGIGLTISRNIMKLHHGSIEVSSTEGTGTQFSLLFPNDQQEDDPITV